MPVIGQRAHGLPESVHEYGCAFMSPRIPLLARGAVPGRCLGRESDRREVRGPRAEPPHEIRLHDPETGRKAADEIAPGLLRYDGYQTAGSVTSELAVAEWHYDERNWTHFVCARRGDSFHVEYDPWPDSQTCRYGHLVSVRGFSKR